MSFYDNFTPAPTPPTHTGGVAVTGTSEDTKYGLAALRREAANVATAAPGQRNDSLNRAYFRMGRLIAGGQLTPGTVRTTLADAGRACGLDEKEISTVLRDDTTSAAAAATVAPRIPEPIDETTTQLTVLELDTPTEPVDQRPAEERFPVLDWHALWADTTEEEWILEPILPARRLIALYSPPKVGKSLLMLEIAVAIARGTPVLGTPTQQKRVLYVDFENDPRGDIRERLQAMGVGPDQLDGLRYLSYPSMAKLDTLAGTQDLMAALTTHQCEVVIIDTISRAVAGEENENDTWLAFYRHTGLALKQAEIACIRLDHSGKDLDKGMRGGSAKYGDVDAVWRLSGVSEDGDVLRLDCTDHRMPIAEKTLVLKRLAGPLRHEVQIEGKAAAFRLRQEELIGWLDTLDVDPKAGRPTAAKKLREAGHKVRDFDVAEAMKERRKRRGLAPLDLEEAFE